MYIVTPLLSTVSFYKIDCMHSVLRVPPRAAGTDYIGLGSWCHKGIVGFCSRMHTMYIPSP